MSGISEEQLIAAIDRVVPNDSDMSEKEIAELLIENEEAFHRALVDVGAVKKSDPGPSDLLDGFYRGGATRTTTVDPRIAKAVRKQFPSQPDVEVREPSESPSLGLFYGGSVETQAGSSKGDYFPSDSD